MPIMGLENEMEDSGLGLKLTDIPGKMVGAAKKKAEATMWDMFWTMLKRKIGL